MLSSTLVPVLSVWFLRRHAGDVQEASYFARLQDAYAALMRGLVAARWPLSLIYLAACAGVMTWMLLEWWDRGKPSVLGMISGAVAGLGTITPASGFVLPWHGVVIGIVAGAICYWACTKLKTKLGYDDSLDVFGVHGVGGILGSILVGVFATRVVNDVAKGGPVGLVDGRGAQILTQLYGVIVIGAFCFIATWAILKVLDLMIGLRVTRDEETEGLDTALHGERVQ